MLPSASASRSDSNRGTLQNQPLISCLAHDPPVVAAAAAFPTFWNLIDWPNGRRFWLVGPQEGPDGGALPGPVLLRAVLPQYPLRRRPALSPEPEPQQTPVVAVRYLPVSPPRPLSLFLFLMEDLGFVLVVGCVCFCGRSCSQQLDCQA